MKKTVSILLIIVMCMGILNVNAATYTLPEKMQKQQQAGSGVKGSFEIDAEGTSPVMNMLEELNGREIQIRSISARDSENSITTLYFDAGDEIRQGLVEIMNMDGAMYFKTDFTGENVYTLGNIKVFFDLLTAEDGQNIQPWSALKSMLSIPEDEWETQWAATVEKYLQYIENWMNGFAAAPETFTTNDGQSAFEMKYIMQPDDIRAGVLELVSLFLNDEEAVSLLSSKVEPEISSVYLNKDLIWYYKEALDSLELNEPVILCRKITTKGDEISSEVSLPLGTNPFSFTNASAVTENGKTEWIFTGEKVSVKYIPGEQKKDENDTLFSCGIVITPSTEAEGILGTFGAYDLTVTGNTETTTDNEGKQHRNEKWQFNLTPDTDLAGENADQYSKCQPMTADLNLHYSSKLAQTSATTLEITASYEYDEDKISAEAKVKTASAWEFVPIQTDSAIPLLKMTENELQQILGKLLMVGK